MNRSARGRPVSGGKPLYKGSKCCNEEECVNLKQVMRILGGNACGAAL